MKQKKYEEIHSDSEMINKNSIDDAKKNRIALFSNHLPGFRVAEFLSKGSKSNQIVALYLTGENPDQDEKIIQIIGISRDRVFVGRDILKNQNHINWLKQEAIDTIICVYWPWLLNEDVFSLAKKTINFHPALLPINRGWFPHVHSLIDGTKTGVTLHKIEKEADTGDIWAQKEIPILITDTAKDIYDRLQSEIVNLFKEKWEDIKFGLISAQPQNPNDAIYHSKKEIEHLDKIDLKEMYKAKDLLCKLRARTFGNKGFAYFEEGGQKIYLNLKLSKTNKFEL
jgi:methionyl-tRNA formyltransferase